MKLYLGSMDVPTPERESLCNAYVDTVEESLRGKSLAIIPGGKDVLTKIEREEFIEAQKQQLGQIVTAPIVVLDLREFAGEHEDKLKQELDKIGSLWMTGGNSFWLRYLMEISGLAGELPGRLEEGSLTGGGYSAGPIVLGRTLDASLVSSDNPNLDEVSGNPEFANKTIWKGIDVVPYTLLPHHGNTDFPELTEAADALLSPDAPTLAGLQAATLLRGEGKLPLTDDQALRAEGGNYSIVGVAA